MRVCIIGTGYVGLVTGACLAEMGNDVTCVDLLPEKIAKLNAGEIPIYEPGLKEIVDRNVAEKRLVFTTDLKAGVENGLLCFICVGTPQDTDGSADLSYVLKVAEQIGQNLSGYKIIIDKSTVPVGTADKVRAKVQAELDKRGVAYEFDVVSNPEFLKEGNAIQDFLRPERVVVGTDNVRTAEILKELYAPFVRTSNHPVIVMDIRSAELTKYASNSFLAAKVTFMNELAILCDRLGADINAVREGMGTDSRIGPRFLLAGPGYGGSCFPKDVRALLATGRENGLELQICAATHSANERQKAYIAGKIAGYFAAKNISKPVLAVWGLTFKPKTDDVRESPAIDIIKNLLAEGVTVRAFDPQGMDNMREILGDQIEYIDEAYAALDGADGLAVVTEWNQFKSPDFARIKATLKTPAIFDARNLFNAAEVREAGLDYFGVGQGH